MPRGPGFPRHVREIAVAEYLAGRATMPVIARELGVTTATISRWVTAARRDGVGAPVLTSTEISFGQKADMILEASGQSLAQRVAELAPPPAPPPAPPDPGLGDGSTAAMIAALSRDYAAHLETAKHANEQRDVKAATAARSAAIKALTEIRQLQRAAREEGGDALAITRDDVDAARLEIRRRLDEISAARGETLMWTLDGTPDVSVAPTSETVTRDASHVTRDTPTPGPRRA